MTPTCLWTRENFRWDARIYREVSCLRFFTRKKMQEESRDLLSRFLCWILWKSEECCSRARLIPDDGDILPLFFLSLLLPKKKGMHRSKRPSLLNMICRVFEGHTDWRLASSSSSSLSQDRPLEITNYPFNIKWVALSVTLIALKDNISSKVVTETSPEASDSWEF